MELLFAPLVFGAVTAWIASRKGHSVVIGFLLGFFLGPIGLIIALVRRRRLGA
ncbi:MAG: hypothetical protein OXH95_00490 [bacterium]|nr:hypothetical protein [bacterium]MDE0642604.1 hypothetical protein [bacterium]